MKRTLLHTALVAVIFTAHLHAQNLDGVRNITVTGTARILVPPDEVIIKLGVLSRGRTVSDTRAKADKAIAGVLDFAKGFGISEADIQTDRMFISPIYDRIDEGSEPKGYSVTKRLHVRLTRISEFDAFIAGALETGVNSIDDVTFKVNNVDADKDSVRVRSLRNAKQKADLLASELGLQASAALSIKVQDVSITSLSRDTWGMEGSAGFGLSGNVQVNASESEPHAPTLAPGQIVISCNSSVMFALTE